MSSVRWVALADKCDAALKAIDEYRVQHYGYEQAKRRCSSPTDALVTEQKAEMEDARHHAGLSISLAADDLKLALLLQRVPHEKILLATDLARSSELYWIIGDYTTARDCIGQAWELIRQQVRVPVAA